MSFQNWVIATWP